MKHAHYSNWFFGNEISEYGKQNGYVDYATLAKSFDAVLANDIISKTNYSCGEWELENGLDYYYEDKEGNILDFDEMTEKKEKIEEKIEELEEKKEETEDEKEIDELQAEIDELQAEIDELENEYYYDVYQYYIISDNGASILKEYTNELVWYNEELDLYVWGVTHYGTSWDYVLTDIKIEKSPYDYDNEGKED